MRSQLRHEDETCACSARQSGEKSEPVAAIGHPPTQDANGNGGEQGPQNGHGKIGDQAQRDECGPEDLTLHPYIVAREIDQATAIAAKVSFEKGRFPQARVMRVGWRRRLTGFLVETD